MKKITNVAIAVATMTVVGCASYPQEGVQTAAQTQAAVNNAINAQAAIDRAKVQAQADAYKKKIDLIRAQQEARRAQLAAQEANVVTTPYVEDARERYIGEFATYLDEEPVIFSETAPKKQYTQADVESVSENKPIVYAKVAKPGYGGTNVVYFDFDSTKLSPDSFAKLGLHVAHLKKYPYKVVQLSGHTDEIGAREYNTVLGERRANAVRNYLLTSGVSAEQIIAVSFGEEMPVGNNQQNRRVEFLYK